MATSEAPARAFARDLWRAGVGRWFHDHPEWACHEPDFEATAVIFRASRGPHELRWRVEARGPGPAAAAGPSLQVIAGTEPGAAAGPFDELARIIVAAPLHAPSPIQIPAKRVELFIVDGCTLRCAFCCESTRIERHTLMPWDTVVAQIDAAAAAGVTIVQFMGGEASLHPRFGDALRRCKEVGLRTYTITNLLRWEDAAFADAVAPWLDEVMISMHAWGTSAGAVITGREAWWERFQRAADNARRTLRATVKASTVLTRHNVEDIERIGDFLLEFHPTLWVMGNPVPVAAARADAIDLGLSLAEQRSMQPRLLALRDRARAAGCRLVYFCVPDCILGPKLWDDSHDRVVDNQDLSEGAPSDSASTFFWSQADFLQAPRPVTLARRRTERCAPCTHADRCGGYFGDFFQRHGDLDLEPIHG